MIQSIRRNAEVRMGDFCGYRSMLSIKRAVLRLSSLVVLLFAGCILIAAVSYAQIPVTLNPNNPLTFVGNTSNDPTQTFTGTITVGGSFNFNYSAQIDPSKYDPSGFRWLAVTQSGRVLTVTATEGKLPQGEYLGTVTITAGTSRLVIPVHFVVFPNVSIALFPPGSMDFPANGSFASQTIAVSAIRLSTDSSTNPIQITYGIDPLSPDPGAILLTPINSSVPVSQFIGGTQTPVASASLDPNFLNSATPGLHSAVIDFINSATRDTVYMVVSITIAAVTVSGTVRGPNSQPLPVVQVQFSNGPTVTTDNSGNYTATLASGYSGTVTAALSGYAFTPPSYSLVNVTTNLTGKDFSGTISTYTISGNVSTAQGRPLPNVQVVFTGAPSAFTDATGYYQAVLPAGYTGTATPTLGSFTFNPPSQTYTNLSANLMNQNYTGAAATSSATYTYYFPHLAFGGGWQTTLTFVSYSRVAAVCETAFYSDSGAPLPVPFADTTGSGRTDNLSVAGNVHAQTQAAANTPLITGWASAQCSQPMQASLLYRLYSGGVAQSEAGVNAMTTPATEFVSFAQTQTGLAYANPSTSTASTLTITALDTTGAKLGSTQVILGAGQHGSANTGPLLGLANFAGSVQLTADSPIVAVFLNAEVFPVFSSLPPADLPNGTPLAGTGAAGALTTATNYYFPHLAFGGGWQTTLTYVNYSPGAVSCQTTFYADSGMTLPVPFVDGTVSIRTDNLPAGADVHIQTQTSASAALLTGWAKATCTGAVKASLLYRLYNSGVPRGEAGVNASSAPTTNFDSFAQTATGVAYANPSSSAANITISVVDQHGMMLGSTNLNLLPASHDAANIGPLLGLQSFTGSVQIVSNVPIVALFLNAEAFPVFSSLPPADLPPGTL
jgi:hypothetical protein